MKVCSKCDQPKSSDEYFYKSRSKNQLHAQCKMCYKIHCKTYMADHYSKYGDSYRERAKIRRAKIRKELQLHLIAYISDKSCVICAESDIRVLEFDHIDPEYKSFGIAKGITNGLKWEAILEEIEKCQILCANCHKKKTARQRNWFKSVGLQ